MQTDFKKSLEIFETKTILDILFITKDKPVRQSDITELLQFDDGVFIRQCIKKMYEEHLLYEYAGHSDDSYPKKGKELKATSKGVAYYKSLINFYKCK